MSNRKAALLVTSILTFTAPAQATPECQGDWVNQSASVEGVVFGNKNFEVELPGDFALNLLPDDKGWRAQVFDNEGQVIPTRSVARGMPPVRGHNNPHMSFVFGPGVLDPALNPELLVPGRPPNVAAVEPSPGIQGNGQLMIVEQGFEPEPPSRRIFMKFEGCVQWNNGPREPDTSSYSSPEALTNFPSWVILAFEDCGLPKTHLLSGRKPRASYRQRAWLEPDIDGDGRSDLVALVDDMKSGASRLAICQQDGKTLTLIGQATKSGAQTLSSDFLIDADWWSIDGRSIILGIEGAGSQRVYRDASGEFVSAWEGD